jgi:hypothetical protein
VENCFIGSEVRNRKTFEDGILLRLFLGGGCSVNFHSQGKQCAEGEKASQKSAGRAADTRMDACQE